MIREKTVLILGAGASRPYNYYTGFELLQKIHKETDHHTRNLYKELINLGYEKQEIIDFNQALHDSGENSVDSFLEYRENKIFWEIGKISMAYLLSGIENSSIGKFYGFENDNWYHHFYNSLRTSFDNFDRNNFAVITFNYDRSFEQYLFTRLKSFGKSDEECAKKLANIDIIHLYGKLDNFPWENVDNDKKREYGHQPNGDRLIETSKGIKIIPESTNVRTDKTFQKSYSILKGAKKIIFLGLNLLNEKNLNRLYIKSHMVIVPSYERLLKFDAENYQVLGTALNLKTAERERIKNFFKENIFLGHPSHSCTDFLRENVTLY